MAIKGFKAAKADGFKAKPADTGAVSLEEAQKNIPSSMRGTPAGTGGSKGGTSSAGAGDVKEESSPSIVTVPAGSGSFKGGHSSSGVTVPTETGVSKGEKPSGNVTVPTESATGAETAAPTEKKQDDRLTKVENDKSAAMTEVKKTYDEMIGQSDQFYQDQINANSKWEEEQKKLQQEQTDFTIGKIQQEKEQAEEDYKKEQSGAYVDWQKQSKNHGVNAEQMAASGMTGSGYSESSRVAMYTAYQNRVAVARESLQKAIVSYNNAMTEARLQNSSALAKIAADALQQRLALAMEGFQYKNSLLQSKMKDMQTVESSFDQRWQSVLDQIYREEAFEEEKRQFDESMAEEIRQYNEKMAEEKRQFDEEMKLAQKENSGVSIMGGAAGGNTIGNSSGASGEESTSSGSGEPVKPKPSAIYTVTQQLINKLPKNKIPSTATPSKAKSAKTSEKTVDMSSVTALGYGPISAERLAELVDSGEVVLVEESGKLVAKRKSMTGPAGNALLNPGKRASSYLGGI